MPPATARQHPAMAAEVFLQAWQSGLELNVLEKRLADGIAVGAAFELPSSWEKMAEALLAVATCHGSMAHGSMADGSMANGGV